MPDLIALRKKKLEQQNASSKEEDESKGLSGAATNAPANKQKTKQSSQNTGGFNLGIPSGMGATDGSGVKKKYKDADKIKWTSDDRKRMSSGGRTYEDTQPTVDTQQMVNPAQPQATSKISDKYKYTSRGILARIGEIYQTDPTAAADAFGQYMQLSQTPGTPFFRPYDSVTNRAVAALEELGIDTTGIGTQEWFDQNSYLQEYLKTSSYTNTPSAPGKRASKEQKAAYWYYQAYKSYEDTMNAQAELAEMQREINYLVGRTDLNLSEDDIIQRLNISNNSKYKTLAKLDKARGSGTSVELNAALGYNGEDDIRTMIWQARNGGGSGSYMKDMISSVTGEGNSWQQNDEIIRKLDPNSDDFSPYSVGMVGMDDVGLYFGVNSFDRQWLQDNQSLAFYGSDKDKEMFNKAIVAVENKEKADEELAKLNEYLKKKIGSGKDFNPQDVLDGIDWKDYPTLAAMDKSMGGKEGSIGTGKWVPTGGAVSYRYKDIRDRVYAAYEEQEKRETPDEKIDSFTPPEAPVVAEDIDALSGPDFAYRNGSESNRSSDSKESENDAEEPVAEAATASQQEQAPVSEAPATEAPAAAEAPATEAPAQAKPPVAATTAGYPKANTKTFPREKTGQQKSESVANATVSKAATALQGSMTKGEQFFFDNAAGVEFNRIVNRLYKDSPLNMHNWVVPAYKNHNLSWTSDLSQRNYKNTAISTLDVRHQYKQLDDKVSSLEATLEKMREDYEYSLVDEEVPTVIKINPGNGQTVELKLMDDGTYAVDNMALELNPETGNYEVGQYLKDTAMTEEDFQSLTGVTVEEYEANVNHAIQDANQFAADVRAAHDKYGSIEGSVELGNRLKEGGEVPTHKDIVEAEMELTRFYHRREELREAYYAAEQQMTDARNRMYRTMDVSLRNGVAVKNPEAIDICVDSHENLMDFEVPEATPISTFRGVMDIVNYNLGKKTVTEMMQAEYEKNSMIERAKNELEGIDATIEDVRFLIDYFSDNTDVDTQGEQNLIDYLNSEKVQLEAVLFSVQDDFQKYVEEGKKIVDRMGLWQFVGKGIIYMDNNDKEMCYALLARDGEEAVKQFYNAIEPSLYAEANEVVRQHAEEAADQGVLGRFFNTGAAVVMMALDLPASVVDLANTALGGEKDIWLRTQDYISQNIFQETQRKVAEIYKDSPVKQKIVSGFYEIMYNRGRSAVAALMTGGLIPEGAGGVMNEAIHAIPIALTAADDALQKYLDAGVDEGHAALLALTTFVSESVTEAISYKHMSEALKAGSLTKGALKQFIASYIPNAASEMTGETINDISEKLADVVWAAEKGDHHALVEAFKAQGYSQDEAEKLAFNKDAHDVLHTMIISMFSPGADIVAFSAAQINQYVALSKEATRQRTLGINQNATVRSVREGKIAMIQAMEAEQQEQEREQEREQNREPGAIDYATLSGLYESWKTSVAEQQATEGDQAANEQQTGEQTQQTTEEVPSGTDVTTETWDVSAQRVNESGYDQDITTIEGMRDSGPTATTATLAAVLGVDEADSNRASAAAALLQGQFGDETTDTVERLLENGRRLGINRAIMKLGLQYTALADGQCRSVVNSEEFKAATPGNQALMLAQAVQADATNQNIQGQVQTAVHDYRVNRVVEQKMANGEASTAVDAQENLKAAEQETADAQENLQNQTEQVEALQENAKVAGEQAINEPTTENVRRAERATDDLKGAVISEEQLRQHEEKQRRAEEEAARKAQQEADETMARMRQEAELEIQQREQEEAERALEAEMRAEEERRQLEIKAEQQLQEENERSRQAAIDRGRQLGEQRADQLGLEGAERDAFVQRYTERAEKAIQNQANMSAAVTLNENGEVTNAEGLLALRGFAQRTGLNIVFKDLGNATDVRGMYDGKGTVILNSQLVKAGNMTTGQALVEAALHEITHAFEGTKQYENYSRTVLDILYGKNSTLENSSDFRNAVKKKIDDYDAAGIDLTAGGKYSKEEGAIREIVADYARTSDMHRKESVQRFVDAGLGGPMRNVLHNINQAIKNFRLTGDERTKAENLRKAEYAYQRALNALAKESLHTTGEQYSIPQFAQAAGLVFNESEQTLSTKDGKIIDGIETHVTADMISGTPMGRLVDGGIRAGTITAEDAAVIKDQFAKLMDMCAKYRNSQMIWEIAACTLESEFSAIKGNSDKQYSSTVDFGTICTKTQAIVDQLSRNMLAAGRGLTIKEILQVYNDVYETNLTVPCPVCYVFSRWMGVPSLLNSMKDYQDRFLGKPGENLSEEEIQRRVDEYISNAQQNYGIDEKFGELVVARRDAAQAKVDKQKLLISELESNVAAKQDVLNDKKARGKATKQAENQLLSAQTKLDDANAKLIALQADLDNVEIGAYGKIINEKKADIEGKKKKKWAAIEGDEGNPGLLKQIDEGKKAGKDVSALEAKLDKLYTEIDELEKQLSDVDGYNWVTQALCKLDRSGRFVLDLASESNPDGFVRTADEILLDLNRTAEFAKDAKNWRYRTTRGAGMGKAILPYSGASIGDSVYGITSRRVVNSFLAAEEDTNAIDKAISNKIKSVRAQNLIGGQRFQSTSDFRPEWGLDYIMTFIEQQVLGSKGQLYTKVAEAVPLFAKAGIDTNLSVMPFGDGYHVDSNGNVVLDFSDVTGMNVDLAKSLKNLYSNVQLILVGINDTHIITALKDPDITFVIPWHSSGNTKGQLASMMNSVNEKLNESSDYTKLQSDTKYEGETALVDSAREKLQNGEDLTQEEIAALKREGNRNVREKILTRGFKHPDDAKGSKKRAPTKSEMDIINGSEYLKDLYHRFYEDKSSDCYGVQLTSSQASQIFPFEYWQMDATKPGGRIETADENGRRFCEYCSELGYVPRFSGRDYEITDENGKTVKNDDGTAKKGNYGNFSGMTVNEDGSRTFDPIEGYWKLLIDRRMYDNDGNYRSQQTISVNGLDVGEMQMNSETGKYELTGSDLNRADINNGKKSKYRLDDPKIIDAHREASRRFDERNGITQVAYENSYQFSVYDDSVTDADIDMDLANDEAYAEAVEQGDMETAQKNVNAAAEQAMQNSKVRDEDDNLLTVYHGTTEDFTVFDMNRGRSTMDIQGAFFSPYDIEAGGYGDKVGSYYLNITNPAPEDVAYAALNRYKGQNEAGKKARERLISMGYDGVENYDEYIAFYPEQIKSADAVTYDDQGNVISLSERFNVQNNDIRYSTGGEQTDADIDTDLAQAGITGEVASEEAAPKVKGITPEDIAKLEQRGLDMLSGKKKPRRESIEGDGQRQFGGEGGMLQASDEIDDIVKNYVKKNNRYFRDTNTAQLGRAVEWIKSNQSESDPTGFYTSIKKLNDTGISLLSADNQARMVAMMGLAVHYGNISAEVQLADLFNRQGTRAGQTLQARKLFRLMTPEGRIQMMQKLLTDTKTEFISQGKEYDLKFSEWIYKAAAAAETEEDYSRVTDAAMDELAAQIPANWKDRIQAWRMLSMLANPRTHARNFIGNAGFVPAVLMKNAFGTGLESYFSNHSFAGYTVDQRTKSIKHTDESKAFAEKDVKEMKDILTGEAKYSNQNAIKRKQKAFGQGNSLLSRTLGKVVQGLSDFNSNMLEKEDWVFLNYHYQNALAGYMTANNLTEENMTGETLDAARTYAVLEAQKATYRDANVVSDWLNQASKEGGMLGFAVDTVVPFKKTPANILRRGVEYSPIGLINSFVTAKKSLDKYAAWERSGFEGDMPKGAKNINQVLDGIAAGMTGTMISAIGALGFALGAVKLGFGGDDDDELKKLRGEQEYSIQLFGHSFTMDWFAPLCMPFFTGASLYKTFVESGHADIREFIDSLSKIAEPVFNLSMLDGFSSLLKTVQGTSGGDVIWKLAQKIGANYAGSMVPSFFGAVARTIDPIRRKIFVQSGTPMSEWAYLIEQVENKLPFLSVNNVPYRNTWGEISQSGHFEAFLENFVLPGYWNDIKDDVVVTELQRLFDTIEDDSIAKGVIPKEAAKTLAGRKLTDEQYDQYAASRGKLAKDLLGKLFDTPEYAAIGMSNPEAQAKLVGDIWTYANQIARHELFPDVKMDTWVSKAYATGKVIEGAFKKEEEAAQKAYVRETNTSLGASLKEGNMSDVMTSVEALRKAGKTDSNIRSTITSQIKLSYQRAVLAEDYDEMDRIKEILKGIDLGKSKYNDDDFKKWAKTAEVDVAKADEENPVLEEEEPTDNNGASRLPEGAMLIAGANGIPTGGMAARYGKRSNNPMDIDNLKDELYKYTEGELYGPGNIDLNHRQVVHNDDGTISTEQALTVGYEDGVYVIPTVIDGRIVSEDEAIEHFERTGEHLGKFDNEEDADEYAWMLHERQAWYYNR